MPIFNDTLLTNKGFEMANKAANGQAAFTITKAVASETSYTNKSEQELRSLTKLDNEIDGLIKAVVTESNKVTGIKTNFTNEFKSNGYTANTVGLYAKDSQSGEEFLYSVTTASVGQVIPETSNNVFSGFELTIYIVVGNSKSLTVTLSRSGDATIDYVNQEISKAKEYAQYNYIRALTDDDDILKLDKNGHYIISGANPANNPWGDKKIWADVYKTDYQTILRDNLGTEYLRSYYDSTWKATLNNLDFDSLIAKNDKAYQFRGYYDGSFSDLYKSKRGSYALAGYKDGMPNGFSGYGNLNLSGNNTDTYFTLNDNLGGMWTKVNDKIWHAVSTNDDADIIFKNRGYWTENLMNLTYQPAGTYGIADNHINAPKGFSGYGVANVYKNDTDSWVDLIDNTNGRWTIHIGSEWQKMINGIDLNEVQSQVNAIDSAYSYQGLIDASVDLNTLTKPGIYYCSYVVPAHAPTQFAGKFPRFKLQVSSFGGEIANQSIYVFDGFGTQGIPSFYNRNAVSPNIWNDWAHTN